jgi:hypothetical protein
VTKPKRHGLKGHNGQQASWQAKVLYQAGQRKKGKMSTKSELAERGMTLAQIGQAYVHAVVDNGGTDDDATRILSDGVLANNLALFTLGYGELVLKPKPVASHCRSLSKGKKVIIGATNGRATIAEAKGTFHGYISRDFVNYGTNVLGQPTKRTRVEVLELVWDGTFGQIYRGFRRNLESLCLTQSQIIRFVKDHVNWLRADGYATIFLFNEKVNGKEEFFVACVRWCGGRLGVDVYSLSYDDVWSAGDRRRIVVPQL